MDSWDKVLIFLPHLLAEDTIVSVLLLQDGPSKRVQNKREGGGGGGGNMMVISELKVGPYQKIICSDQTLITE
jgi:hypothetical protein